MATEQKDPSFQDLPTWKRKDIITPKKPLKKLAPPKFGVFDIETEPIGSNENGVGQFIMAASFSPQTGYRTHTTLKELAELIVSSREDGIDAWYVHNGTSFDYLYLLADKPARRILKRHYDIKPLKSKQSAVGLSLVEKNVPEGKRPKRIALRDFYRIFKAPLKDITEELNVPHKKLHEIDFENGEVFDPNNPQHMIYLEHDVYGLYESVTMFRKLWFEIFQDDLGWTLPGMAYSAWRRTINKSYYRHDKAMRDYFRKTYRGGMVIPHYSVITEKVVPIQLISAVRLTGPIRIASFDVNSMYPARMLEGVPVGNPFRLSDYVKGVPAYYDVTLSAPTDGLTFIAVKSKTGLQYPRGTFRAQVTSQEISLALKHGYKIIEVHSGYGFSEIEKIFDTFLKKCMEIRRDHKGTILETVAKLAQNALYGKFGMGEDDVTEIIITDNPPASDTMQYWNEDTGSYEKDMYEIESEMDVPYLHPEWASWVTAGARMTLAQTILNFGYDRFVYSDTDSIKVVINGMTNDEIHDRVDIDPIRYGAWKHEYTLKEWYCAGPKTYAGIFVEPIIKKGKTLIDTFHTKGVPTKKVNTEMIKKAAHSEEVKIGFVQGRSMLTMLHQGYQPEWKTISRALTTPEKALNWEFDGSAWGPKDYISDEEYDRIREERAFLFEMRQLENAFKRNLYHAIMPTGLNDRDYEHIPRALFRKKGRPLDEFSLDVMDAIGQELDADGIYELIHKYWR